MTSTNLDNPACGVDFHCGDSILQQLLFLFDPVWWRYPFKNFDNTAPTYITDYALAVFMFYAAYTIFRDSSASPLRTRSIVLFLLYAVSVLSGGIAHQYFVCPSTLSSSFLISETTAESINTTSFRILWTICVGSVCAAAGAFGSIATQLAQIYPSSEYIAESTGNNFPVRKLSYNMGAMCGAGLGALGGGLLGGCYGLLPNTSLYLYASTLNPSGRSGSMICIIIASTLGIVSGLVVGGYYGFRKPNQVVKCATSKKFETFWLCWAFLLVYLTWNGALSMLQPAADIFVAGFTQAFSIMFLFAVLAINGECDEKLISKQTRLLFLTGIHFNMPLIFIYPLVLANFPQVSLGVVNTCLHLSLTIGWGLQWYTLRKMCRAYYPIADPDWLKIQSKIFNKKTI